MALVVSNVSEGLALEKIVNKSAGENLVLKLYQNNYTPVEGSTAVNFTEATFAGYAAITLVGANWTITTGDPTYASYAQQTFTRTSTGAVQNIYGYFLVGLGSGTLYWAELFTDGPYPVTNNTDAVKVTPYIELA